MIISVDAEKLTKIQHPFMIFLKRNPQQSVDIKEHTSIYDRPTSNIILQKIQSML